jgi:ABC-type transporter Mla subunit MlaD
MAAAAEQMSVNVSSISSASEEVSVNVGSIVQSADATSRSVVSVAESIARITASLQDVARDAKHGTQITQQAKDMAAAATGTMRQLDHAASEITKVTEVNARRLRSAILQIRRQGYATIVDQLFYGVTSLTVPILDSIGGTIAALNTSTYTGHMTADELIKGRLTELRRSSEQLTRIITNHPSLQQALRTGPEYSRPDFDAVSAGGARSKQSNHPLGDRNGRKTG